MVLQTTPSALKITWETFPKNYKLSDFPAENIQQPFLAAALTDALDSAGLVQPEMLIASNFALVATVNQKTVVKAPDWLFVPTVLPIAQNLVRRSYTPTLEGEPVAVVMEFLSETDGGEYSVRSTPPYGKLYFYEHILKVPTYVLFDPQELLLDVRQLQNGQYVRQTPNAQGHYWIPEVKLFLGRWQGTRLGITTHWLRWWDESGNLLLWSSEQVVEERQRAGQERQRADAAEQELARLRIQLQERQQP
ncbi:MAG: Uma2 family endonuclease [Timaviella obliquedivisa GSE-PSE-MK23-08B]|jgi:Uma2 family endonuclease|nr:Uma2 family endonuclease [Timaviella obliquedivisa GSE-PSE-MK23-08B]